MAIRTMLPLDSVERVIWLLAVAGYAVLYIRLRHEGLHRTYRFFAAYVLFRVVRAGVLAAAAPVASLVTHKSSSAFEADVYGWTWLVTEPMLWVLYILVVLELYTLVLQKFRGIASLGRWAILAGLIVALAIASLTLSADFSNHGEKFPILRYALVMHRAVASSLVIFVLLITAFLASYPVPLSRNVVVHSIAYAVYFLSVTAAVLVRNVGGDTMTELVNVSGAAVSLVCLAVWITFLNRQGETRSVALLQKWRPEQADRLVEQLSAINSSLMRTARK